MLFDVTVSVNDVVAFENEHGQPDYGIVAHISQDPDMKPLLIRDAGGNERRIMYDDVAGIVTGHVLDGLISLYMLQLFGKYKQEEISQQISFSIEAQASSSARELEVKHIAKIGWDKKFESASLTTSLERIISRHREDLRHEVKALPAS